MTQEDLINLVCDGCGHKLADHDSMIIGRNVEPELLKEPCALCDCPNYYNDV